MSTPKRTMDVLLPWPHAWDQMQWQIAAWVSENQDRARVQVLWNETRLSAQVDVAAFQTLTTDFYQALQQRLGLGFEWRFEKHGELTGHRLILDICAPNGA
jgi:hypothetical protein